MGVRTQVRVPNQVQFRFSLRDESNRTIFLPSQEIRAGARVFERAVVEEAGQFVEIGEWEEIDYSETNLFVHGAENLRLEVVFILDFTKSMAEGRLSDGTGNIQAMLESFFQALNVLPEAHRVGVVEFHDRNVGPSVLSDLTTDREVVRKAVSAFLTSPFDPGSSRLWDSVELASTLLTRGQENPDLSRAIVFYSDGRDTSSRPTRSEIGELASSNDIQLFAVGTGQVFEEQRLVNMVLATGGAYYSADDLRGLQSNQLGFLINDLLGQYKISYLTLRREGSHLVRLELTLGEIIGIYESGALDTSTFLGPRHPGPHRLRSTLPGQGAGQSRGVCSRSTRPEKHHPIQV